MSCPFPLSRRPLELCFEVSTRMTGLLRCLIRKRYRKPLADGTELTRVHGHGHVASMRAWFVTWSNLILYSKPAHSTAALLPRPFRPCPTSLGGSRGVLWRARPLAPTRDRDSLSCVYTAVRALGFAQQPCRIRITSAHRLSEQAGNDPRSLRI
jgi:hypothetical protein